MCLYAVRLGSQAMCHNMTGSVPPLHKLAHPWKLHPFHALVLMVAFPRQLCEATLQCKLCTKHWPHQMECLSAGLPLSMCSLATTVQAGKVTRQEWQSPGETLVKVASHPACRSAWSTTSKLDCPFNRLLPFHLKCHHLLNISAAVNLTTIKMYLLRAILEVMVPCNDC